MQSIVRTVPWPSPLPYCLQQPSTESIQKHLQLEHIPIQQGLRTSVLVTKSEGFVARHRPSGTPTSTETMCQPTLALQELLSLSDAAARLDVAHR